MVYGIDWYLYCLVFVIVVFEIIYNDVVIVFKFVVILGVEN